MGDAEELKEIKEVAELSEEEFKNKILIWFKERGLLSELRSHLRYQMINFLKDTEIGNALITKVPRTFSSKLRAIHFLVAEFLLHSQHYYSLSILVSEVPFLNVFPQMTSQKSSLTVLQSADSEIQKFRFQKNEILDILQVLGICKRSYEETQILKSYLKSSDHALLALVLEILLEKTALTESTESSDENAEVVSATKDSIGYRWNIAVQAILKNSFERGSNIYAIKDRILRFFFAEFDKIRNEAEEKCKIELTKLKESVEKDVKCKEKLFKQELLNLEEKHKKQMQVLQECSKVIEAEFAKKEKDLTKQLSLKEQQHSKELQLLKERLNENSKLIEKFRKEINYLKTHRTEAHLREFAQLKAEYKSVLQHLKQKYKKTLDKLQETQNTVHDREQTIWDLHQQMSKEHDKLNQTIAAQLKEIKRLKETQELLNEQLEKEKENTKTCQKKYTEQLDINREANQNIELYKQRLNELNIRFERFKNEFQKSTTERKTGKKSSPITYCPRRAKSKFKSKIRKQKLSSSSDSTDSNTTSFPFDSILKETQQRLQELENTTKQVEENYKKSLQTLPKFNPPNPPTNTFKFVQETNSKPDKNIDFKIFFDQIREFNSNISILSQISSSVLVQDSNQRMNQIQEISEVKTKPILQEITKNLQLSFGQVEETMNDVSYIVRNFVKKSTKLSEQSEIVQNLDDFDPSDNALTFDSKLLVNLDEMEKELDTVEKDLLSKISLSALKDSNKIESTENSIELSESPKSEIQFPTDENLPVENPSNTTEKPEMEAESVTNRSESPTMSKISLPALKDSDKIELSESSTEISESQKSKIQFPTDESVPFEEQNSKSNRTEQPKSPILMEEDLETIDEDVEDDFKTVLNDSNLIDLVVTQTRENYQELKDELRTPLTIMDIILESDEDMEAENINEKVINVETFVEDDSDLDIEHIIEQVDEPVSNSDSQLDESLTTPCYVTCSDQILNSNLIHIVKSAVQQVSTLATTSVSQYSIMPAKKRHVKFSCKRLRKYKSNAFVRENLRNKRILNELQHALEILRSDQLFNHQTVSSVKS